MKTKFKAGILLLFMMSLSALKAEDISLPIITRPAALNEGIETKLSPSQIAELTPWAKDSKAYLYDLLESAEGLSSYEKLDRLIMGIKSVVGESAPKNSELLMRYILNRGLVVDEILNKEADINEIGAVDTHLRVLATTIKMAIKYYETDMKVLNQKTEMPFAKFGVDYFHTLIELNKSIYDASAQYSIERTALEWFQWDLYRDLNNKENAAVILKINNYLKNFPTTKISDKQSLSHLRQMKKLIESLDKIKIAEITSHCSFIEGARNKRWEFENNKFTSSDYGFPSPTKLEYLNKSKLETDPNFPNLKYLFVRSQNIEGWVMARATNCIE
ncbi:MAG: hypothetical protein KBD76_15565 [Bacteriovorax sp.]|nr:hypothetical protein [Bacteriovorax sp.]